MKNHKITRMALVAIAAAGLATNFAAAQGLGGEIAGQLGGGAGNSALNNQVQQQIQGQVQQQVQEQVQAQVQSQMQNQLQAQVQGQLSSQAQFHADVARAGLMAQQAIDTARQHAVGERGMNAEGSLGARIDANVQAKSQLGQQQNALSVRSDGSLNSSFNRPQVNLPPGFAEADVQVYDAVFGNFNPFRAEVEQTGSTESTTRVEQRMTGRIPAQANSSQGVVAASATTELDLAVRIDSAVHQRRAEISLMRDRALDASNELMMEQAEQMEKVLDLFIEARAHAAAESRSRMNVEGSRGQAMPNNSGANSLRTNAEQNLQIQGNAGARFGNGGR